MFIVFGKKLVFSNNEISISGDACNILINIVAVIIMTGNNENRKPKAQADA